MRRRPLLVLLVALGAVTAAAWLSEVRAQSRAPRAALSRAAMPPDPRGPSPLVYPPQRIALRMDHSLPAHRELRCVRCHRGAGLSERAADSLIPREQSCAPCHDADLDREAPTAARCGLCHVGYRDGEAPAVSDFPTARLRFSHRAHVARGMRCLSCHEGVEQARVADRRHLPRMRSCFECHGPPGFAAEASAPSACPTCHLTEPDGRLRARFPEGDMNPPGWLLDMRHDHEWLVRHRWVGADQGAACASCHEESECAECHDGQVRLRRIHPGDYLTTHVAQARRDQPRCTSCHQVSTFCTECHARLGLSPLSAPSVRATERYHPPPAVWVRGPIRHALEARRAMSTCASCHAERDCVVCHGALGIGAGLSPHPPSFLASCGAALATNARACVTCHGDLDALRRRCL
ncbi:MAG: cytochrome c3 family protein [Sandaracinaceae bacterium]|nr:cytochrome c3 family protein [Sandaracinaceae bacterium]